MLSLGGTNCKKRGQDMEIHGEYLGGNDEIDEKEVCLIPFS